MKVSPYFLTQVVTWIPLGRPGCRWEDNSSMDLGWEKCRLDSSGSGQEPEAGSCEQGNEPFGSIKNKEFPG
jgi:hypothetical protein